MLNRIKSEQEGCSDEVYKLVTKEFTWHCVHDGSQRLNVLMTSPSWSSQTHRAEIITVFHKPAAEIPYWRLKFDRSCPVQLPHSLFAWFVSNPSWRVRGELTGRRRRVQPTYCPLLSTNSTAMGAVLGAFSTASWVSSDNANINCAVNYLTGLNPFEM